MAKDVEEPYFCPVCGERGSLHKKIVKNNYGKQYRYIYCGHYQQKNGNTVKVLWHYVGRENEVNNGSNVVAQTNRSKLQGVSK